MEETTKKKRMNVTVSENLYNELKVRADLLGTSVPSVLVFYAFQGISQERAINSIDSMLSAMKNFEEQKN